MSWGILKSGLLAEAASKMQDAPVYVSMENAGKEGELVPVYGIEMRDGKAVIVLTP